MHFTNYLRSHSISYYCISENISKCIDEVNRLCDKLKAKTDSIHICADCCKIKLEIVWNAEYSTIAQTEGITKNLNTRLASYQ